MDKSKITPMMQHWFTLKEQNPDSILFYRLGDFYEMFNDDARTASQELDLVLTARAAGNGQKAPMCGIPFHAAENYIQRLVKKGYKIAICEQLSDPSASKGLVKRDIIKIITPGTYIESANAKQSQYLAAITSDSLHTAILYCELSTGELLWQKTDRSLMAVQKALKEKEVLETVVERSFPKTWKQALAGQEGFLLSQSSLKALTEEEQRLVPQEDKLLSQALALLMQYLEDTQKQSMSHLFPAIPLHEASTMKMDQETRRHLELTETSSQAGNAQSLWEFMDRCKTAMGSRTLRKWIENPSTDVETICQRQEAIQIFLDQFLLRESLTDHLERIYDLERLSSRISIGTAGPRDILQLVSSLEQMPEIKSLAARVHSFPEWSLLPDLKPLYSLTKDAIRPDAPQLARDGNIFQEGYNARLDRLNELAGNGRKIILEMEAQERERTGIKSLKIGYNRVFGYYIDVTKTNVPQIKPEFGYQTIQTLANSIRYTMPKLKETETEILTATEEKEKLEQSLYAELLDRIKEDLYDIHMAAQILAQIDILTSLASLAAEYGYIRPAFNETHTVAVEEGRHPVLEQRMDAFTSNSWSMDENTEILVVTGPNMGGKSTWMRQNALLAVMAQTGSFIPARKASLPVFDQIFTRMGAADDLLAGTSTFMAEMQEANLALQYATKNSLILFDEIGRGTATYDGMALAQAILEYIGNAIHAKTLFSTHYHELTSLEADLPGLSNVHVDVKEKKEEIRFLYRIVSGKSDKSYGIHVARLARLPQTVIHRASALLEGLEAAADKESWQPNLFVMDQPDPNKSLLMEKLDLLDLDDLTPRQALQCLYELKQIRKEVKD